MDSEINILNYLQKSLSLAPQLIKQMTLSRQAQPYPCRDLKFLVDEYVQDFLKTPSVGNKWIVVPGLRGVGKTTLLAQVYLNLLNRTDINLLYLSLNEIVDNLNGNLYETLQVYEKILGADLVEVNKPTLIFIDEVQADPKWAKTLKNIYDHTRFVFLFCTGSSAAHLQMDADVAGRRAKIEKLYPLSFCEFHLLQSQKQLTVGLKDQIIDALYFSSNAQSAYSKLKQLEVLVNQAWLNYPKSSLQTYLTSGTMPFVLEQLDDRRIKEGLEQMLDKIVDTDLKDLRFFDFVSRSAIKRLLLVLASSSEAISAEKIGRILNVGRNQIFAFLDVLVKAELLIKIPAFGKVLKTVRQPARYKFMSPAIRCFYHGIVDIQTQSSLNGLLLEDVAALNYYRNFIANHRASLSYPLGDSQADFILQIKNQSSLAIEFGLGNKNIDQLKQTLTKVDCRYGIVFAQTQLELIDDKYLKVPLDYFLLT